MYKRNNFDFVKMQEKRKRKMAKVPKARRKKNPLQPRPFKLLEDLDGVPKLFS